MEHEERQKILVVDDDARWLKRISRILEADYHLTLTTDPLEGLEALKSSPYALVILDMKLPGGVSGLNLFSEMQNISPGLHAIILTAYPDPGSMRKSFKTGFLDYLEKGNPNLREELKEAVKETVGSSATTDIEVLIAGGEGEALEFKSSARWDIRANQVNKDLEKVIVKTIAGFLNSEGGTALIGVDDGGAIVGLQPDYETLSKKNRDGYENFLNNLLLNAFGKDLSLFLHISFYEIQGKDICRIDAKPSTKPIFVVEDKNDRLYIRVGNSTRSLSTSEAINYVRTRWQN